MKVEVFEDEQFYICHDGRELRRIRKLKSRMVIPRPLRYTAAPTAVDANIKPAVCINIMPKKDTEKNKIMKINEQWEELREIPMQTSKVSV